MNRVRKIVMNQGTLEKKMAEPTNVYNIHIAPKLKNNKNFAVSWRFSHESTSQKPQQIDMHRKLITKVNNRLNIPPKATTLSHHSVIRQSNPSQSIWAEFHMVKWSHLTPLTSMFFLFIGSNYYFNFVNLTAQF